MAQEDALAIAQNGGVSSSDEGDLDGDADDLDDDMMDKISSSPSIEDGGCRPVTVLAAWPRRVSSLPSSLRSSSPSLLELSSRPPTPYADAFEYLPNHTTDSPPQIPSPDTFEQVQHHHLRCEHLNSDTCDADRLDEYPEHEEPSLVDEDGNNLEKEKGQGVKLGG